MLHKRTVCASKPSQSYSGLTSTSMQLQKGMTGVGLQPMRVRTSTPTALCYYKPFPQTIHEIRKRPVVGAHVTTSEAVSRFFFDIFLFAASARSRPARSWAS